MLHTYPYKETSLIVEAFTRRFGRVALLARGARRPRSAMRGVLLSFQPLRLSWSASAELGNLIAAEWAGALQPLARARPDVRLLPERAAAAAAAARRPARGALRLPTAMRWPRLRSREPMLRVVLRELREAPARRARVCAAARPRRGEPADRSRPRSTSTSPSAGPTLVNGTTARRPPVVSGRTLLDVAADDYTTRRRRATRRATLMRALIGERLHGQVLHTRTVLQD